MKMQRSRGWSLGSRWSDDVEAGKGNTSSSSRRPWMWSGPLSSQRVPGEAARTCLCH